MTPATVPVLIFLGSCCLSFLEDMEEFGQGWFGSQLRRSSPSVQAGVDARLSPGLLSNCAGSHRGRFGW